MSIARKLVTAGMLALGFTVSAFADTTVVNGILSVTPSSATQGVSGLVVTFALSPTNSPPVPPAGAPVTSMTLGTNAGSSLVHTSQYVVSGAFTINPSETAGLKDVAVTFTLPDTTKLIYNRLQAFQVVANTNVTAGFSGAPVYGLPPLTVTFANTSSGPVASQWWTFGDGASSPALNPTHTYTNPGLYTVSLAVIGAGGSNTLTRAAYVTVTTNTGTYLVVDTAQVACYNNTASIAPPLAGQGFYGQDAQLFGNQPSYTVSGDGKTVYDNNTGLTWQRSPDTTGDTLLNITDKLTWAQAQARPAALNAAHFGGYSDWRLPTIKELYSLMDFRGTDPSGLAGNDTSGLTPFIDTNAFRFAYGNTNDGERIIDSQYASSTLYVAPDYTGEGGKLFGVNFADGRIKGYGLTMGGGAAKTFFVQCVRGNPAYGLNLFVDNGDQTITDKATGLMWSKADSGVGLNWSNALAWVQARNAVNYLGHNDWRLPNAKELQGLLDYTRSPDTTASAAMDPVFACTLITNEHYQADYPWYWTGTTHGQYTGSGASGAYVCFGRSMGYMNGSWQDVHGAGAQRSDPKGSLSGYTALDNGYYNSIAPQGDAVRMNNFVRLVRGGSNSEVDHVGDGIPDGWRRQYFGGSGMTTNAASCASGDGDGDGMTTLQEYLADTNPTNASSRLAILAVAAAPGSVTLNWTGGGNAWQYLESASTLASNAWTAVYTNTPPTPVTNAFNLGTPAASNRFYRLQARRSP